MNRHILNKTKRCFYFDNEPLSGGIFLLRYLIGYILGHFIIGLFLIAATVYKRNRTLGVKKELNEISVFYITTIITNNILFNYTQKSLIEIPESFKGLFYLFNLSIMIFLIFKNKSKKLELASQPQKSLIVNSENLELNFDCKIKYFYRDIYYQLTLDVVNLDSISNFNQKKIRLDFVGNDENVLGSEFFTINISNKSILKLEGQFELPKQDYDNLKLVKVYEVSY